MFVRWADLDLVYYATAWQSNGNEITILLQILARMIHSIELPEYTFLFHDNGLVIVFTHCQICPGFYFLRRTGGVKPAESPLSPAKDEFPAISSSIRRSSLYLATRSLRAGAPVLI